MIEMIENLIKNGLAYESEGDVYYAVEKFTEYGKLSNRNIEDMLAGARVEVLKGKRNPLDFALWKKSKENEPSWDSPWGKGRPGWHIECSTMSTKYLGKTFDIHGGGKDLVFPHHENEIAQAEGANGQKYVNYWMHNGFVNIDGAKMSKSLGNFFTIRNLLENYNSEVIRFFVLSNHYRSPINFKVEKYNDETGKERVRFVSLDETEDRLYYIYDTLDKMNSIINSPGKEGVNLNPEFTENILKKFEEAMDDDFNTAAALGEFSKVIKFINEIITKPKTKMKNKKATLKEVAPQIKTIAEILNIFNKEPKKFLNSITEKRLKIRNIDKNMILELIEERNLAKKEKNYQKSDEIRDKLNNMGVVIQDTPNGVEWRLN
jgi:cysteinyl-tRNA synthetase